MNENAEPTQSDKDAELEREIRKGRKFTLAEAIGRLAGPGMMKGVSPVSLIRQAEAKINDFLTRQLTDSGGALKTVILRRITNTELLLNNPDQPLIVLASGIERVLQSDYLLKELVRDADIEWGQIFGQRPYFEEEGCAPDPNDPYTFESVRNTLSQLLEKLAEAAS